MGHDLLERAVALEGGQVFGVVDADGPALALKNDGSRDHRPGPRAAPSLIDAGDAGKTGLASELLRPSVGEVPSKGLRPASRDHRLGLKEECPRAGGKQL
jgi:hypothetical protein